MVGYNLCNKTYFIGHILPGLLLLLFIGVCLATLGLTVPFFPNPLFHIYTAFYCYFILNTLVVFIQIQIVPPPFATYYDMNNLTEYYQKLQNIYVCETCHRIRNLRTHHCNVCGNCVDRFDHHCPWSFRCVGQSNYAYFLKFVVGCFVSHTGSLIVGVWAFCEGFYKAPTWVFGVLTALIVCIILFEVNVLYNQMIALFFNMTMCERKTAEQQAKQQHCRACKIFKQNQFNKGYAENAKEWIGGGFWRRQLFYWTIGLPSCQDKNLIYTNVQNSDAAA